MYEMIHNDSYEFKIILNIYSFIIFAVVFKLELKFQKSRQHTESFMKRRYNYNYIYNI